MSSDKGSDGSDNVVYLRFENPEVQEDAIAFLSCNTCRNKTYTLIMGNDKFPRVACAACGQHIGKIGWYNDEDQ